MKLKYYTLTDEIKKQLGYIIREIRKQKYNEYKNVTLIENNPYTKENFCENNVICHYHTLTRLENDIVKDDVLYHVLLKKLDLYYQVSEEEHEANMAYLENQTRRILYAGEYIDDDLAKSIKTELDEVSYSKDVIAEFHLRLLKTFIKLQLIMKVTDEEIEVLTNFVDFFQGIYAGVANHCIGIYHLNKLDTTEAKHLFLKAQEIYDIYNISKGLISSYLIAVHVSDSNYYESVPLCNEMEDYYTETKNYKRLMHVYTYLSDYYFLINARNVAKEYFDKAIAIIDKDETLIRYKYVLLYNWGYHCFKNFQFEEALENFLASLALCSNNTNYLQILNFILIIKTKLKHPVEELEYYCSLGEQYVNHSNEANQNTYKYFRFKLSNSRYYRKFAIEKLIPQLKKDRTKMEVLLLLYEDLYK